MTLLGTNRAAVSSIHRCYLRVPYYQSRNSGSEPKEVGKCGSLFTVDPTYGQQNDGPQTSIITQKHQNQKLQLRTVLSAGMQAAVQQKSQENRK